MRELALRVNGNSLIPVFNVRRIRHLTEADVEMICNRMGMNSFEYASRIELADFSTILVRENIDEFEQAGVAMIEISRNVWMPAINVKGIEALSEQEQLEAIEEGFDGIDRALTRVVSTAGEFKSTESEKTLAYRVKTARLRMMAAENDLPILSR